MSRFRFHLNRSARLAGRLTAGVALAALLLVQGIPPASAATNGTITAFGTGISSGAGPVGITAGPDGNVWFTEDSAGQIGRITPGGTVTEFSTGITANSAPERITAGPDGNLWFTEEGANQIGRITPSGTVTEFSAGITANSLPLGIAAGPDGNVWFTEENGNRIGRITPSGTVTEFSTGITANSLPLGIAAGPDGNLWFTEYSVDQIGRITPSGTVTEFNTGITVNSRPFGITAGPDGNLWFTESSASHIGRITPSGAVTEFSTGITANSEPLGIAAGPDGNLWFTEGLGIRIGRITPSGTVTELSNGICTDGGPFGITAGPDGNLWFTHHKCDQIGRVELAPTASAGPTALAFGSQPVATSSAVQTVTVSNSGGRALTVSGFAFNGANPADFTTTNDGCTGTSVAVGGTCTVGVAFLPTALGSRSATLVVTDDADNTPGSTQTISLSGTGAANADLNLSIGVSPNPATVGKPLTYTITVANAGPTAASGVVVTDTLPASAQFVGVTPSQGTCTAPAPGATGTLTCSLGSVAAGTNVPTKIVVKLIAPHKSTVSDTATVTSASFDSNPGNNSATVTVLLK